MTATTPPAASAAPDNPAASTFWPLAGTADYARTDATWRTELAARIARDLRRHVAEPWFPRSVDHVDGGFWADFDRRWRRRGAGQRMLEFQARQTRTAARLGLAFPAERDGWAEIALHGLRYLREVMADPEMGGWFWLVDRAGRPLHGSTKHAHGAAYLVGAAVDVYQLTGRDDALAAAQQMFEWLDAHHHDEVHGGYHGWVTRAGRPILTAADVPAGAPLAEPLGHGIGLKDANVNCDLLEAYTALARVWPDRRVLERMAEIYQITTQRLVTADGALHYMTHVDWTPVATVEHYGYSLQQPLRLLAAAGLLGGEAGGALEVAYRLVDHALRRAWDDQRNLFIEAGPAAEPDALGRHSLRVSQFSWWVQTEALRSLVLLSVLPNQPAHYRAMLERLLAAVEGELIDHRAGGWHPEPVRDVPLRRRLRGEPAKGDAWKDASHEADAYLAALRMLRGLPADAPLDGPG